MEARTPGTAGTELSELDPALIAGRCRVRCLLLEHATGREVTVGLAEGAGAGNRAIYPRRRAGRCPPVRRSAARPHPRPAPHRRGRRAAATPAPNSTPTPPPQPRPAASIRDRPARWHMDDLADDAQAIASELAANAIAAVPPDSPGLCLIFAIHHRPPS